MSLTEIAGVALPAIAIFGLSNQAITNLIDAVGYPIVGIFVGIESSGIPFPGETALVLAAVYAGTAGKHFSILWVIVSASIGAIVGDNIGYVVGRFGGRRLVNSYGHKVRIRPHHLDRAEAFFRRHGNKTVFLGRFVAVLRAWAAFLAGVNRMRWPEFMLFNAAGGIVWATTYGLLGYLLGHNLPMLYRVLRILGIGGVVGAVLVIAVAGLLAWRHNHRKA